MAYNLYGDILCDLSLFPDLVYAKRESLFISLGRNLLFKSDSDVLESDLYENMMGVLTTVIYYDDISYKTRRRIRDSAELRAREAHKLSLDSVDLGYHDQRPIA